VVEIGLDKIPAGPDIEKAEEVILVEGRADVINLVKHGIKNAIGVGGTSVPLALKPLCANKKVTVFLDGDRGGDLILKKLLHVVDIDFVARAPLGREVEELAGKEIIKALRLKVSKEDAKRSVELLRHCLMQVGFDPETGQIDIDRISTGISASTRGKIIAVKEIIIDLERKGLKDIPLEEIITQAASRGIEEGKVEEAIDQLKKSGDIFEPKRGYISRVN